MNSSDYAASTLLSPQSTKPDESGKDEPDQVSFIELARFAGDDKYPERWRRLHEGTSAYAGFNPWACIYGIQWFFFRKLYGAGVFSFVVEIFAPVSFYFLVSPLLPSASISWGVIIVYAIITRILIGLWANVALYKRALRVIREVDELNLDNDLHLRLIAARGGVSFGGLFLAYLLPVSLKLLRP